MVDAARPGCRCRWAGNVIRKDIPPAERSVIASILRESIRYGLEHRAEAVEHSMPLARGMNIPMADKFIGMYVNDYTLRLRRNGTTGDPRVAGAGARGGNHPGAGGAGVCGYEPGNSKFETRNSNATRVSPKPFLAPRYFDFEFRISNFPPISNFRFRICSCESHPGFRFGDPPLSRTSRSHPRPARCSSGCTRRG